MLCCYHTEMVICSLLTPHCDCHSLSFETTLWLPSVLSWYHTVIAIHSLLKSHSDCHMFFPDTTMCVITIHSLLIPHCDCHLFSFSLDTTSCLSFTLSWNHIVTTICSLLTPHCDHHSLIIETILWLPLVPCRYQIAMTICAFGQYTVNIICSPLISLWNSNLLSVDTTL